MHWKCCAGTCSEAGGTCSEPPEATALKRPEATATPLPALNLLSTAREARLLHSSAMTLSPFVLAASYLLGSLPFGYLLVRIFRKQDIRATGSGNIGATNVARSGARGLGVLTLVLDLAKGYAAVLLARHVRPGLPGLPSDLAVGAAIAAVVGHVYPVWLRFRGGKGVATALGVFLALVPIVVLPALGVFAVVVLLTRFVSLASILAAATLPVFAILLSPDRSPLFLGGLCFIALLVILKHHANIARLLAGRENRFGTPRRFGSSKSPYTALAENRELAASAASEKKVRI